MPINYQNQNQNYEFFFCFKVVPRNLLFAHGSEIISIACPTDGSIEHPNIVSLASNGYDLEFS